jgi:RNA polymerase sigma-70 factor (sigma-E family)
MTFEEYASWRLPSVLRFAAVLTGDRGLAEDVVQEVLIRAHRHWGRISRLDRPDTYIKRMVVNEYITVRRKSWRLLPSGQATDVDHRVTPDYAGYHAERDALLTELGKLPARQRTVLVLRYYEGLSDTEIAEVLGCRPGTVRGYIARALAALRVELTSGQCRSPEPALTQEER